MARGKRAKAEVAGTATRLNTTIPGETDRKLRVICEPYGGDRQLGLVFAIEAGYVATMTQRAALARLEAQAKKNPCKIDPSEETNTEGKP